MGVSDRVGSCLAGSYAATHGSAAVSELSARCLTFLVQLCSLRHYLHVGKTFVCRHPSHVIIFGHSTATKKCPGGKFCDQEVMSLGVFRADKACVAL